MTATHQIETNATQSLAERCLTSCRKLVGQIERTKNAIAAEFRGMMGRHQHVLQLALNEAEALAWETGFPSLVFPTLAAEKAEEVAAWHKRQLSGKLRFTESQSEALRLIG